MKTVAVYNMKGGVGKTTTAVNLSALAVASGARVLLWDLDPQAAASFALRVRPHVPGFRKRSLRTGEAFSAAIRETDYRGLDLLPADFAYRKLDRMLDELGKPERVVTDLVNTIGRDYDLVFLDCPPGFSRLIEGTFAAADAVLVPTIPTTLSLRTLARLIKWADRTDSQTALLAFFNMVDRRKVLHRSACEWSLHHPEIFLTGRIPYASVVEQMAVRRLPLAAFAARDAATISFAELWTELQAKFSARTDTCEPKHNWSDGLIAIEALIARLEAAHERTPSGSSGASHAGVDHGFQGARRHLDVEEPRSQVVRRGAFATPRSAGGNSRGQGWLIHTFDTEQRHLQRAGHVLELHERPGDLLVVAARFSVGAGTDVSAEGQARIDSSWAVEILSGSMSPLAALDRRLGRPGPRPVEDVRAVVGERTLRRVDSRVAGSTSEGGVTEFGVDIHASSAAVRPAGGATVIPMPPRPARVG